MVGKIDCEMDYGNIAWAVNRFTKCQGGFCFNGVEIYEPTGHTLDYGFVGENH